ncbi:MAG: hypothetical protein RR280_07475 [Bacteroidaceae bacterium]
MTISKDIHFLGEYRNLEEVYQLYPYGGAIGDYIFLNKEKVFWNDTFRIWGDKKTIPSPTEDHTDINGNLNVYGDVTISGTLTVKRIHCPDYNDIFLQIETNGDQFLAYGESITLKCKVMRGFENISNTVTQWCIKRQSGDTVNDNAWLLKGKVKNFAGSIDICFTSEENDLSTTSLSGSTEFTITASGDHSVIAKSIITI